MIFQIKKDKPNLETETIERWRRVSLAAEKERSQLNKQSDILDEVDKPEPVKEPEEDFYLDEKKSNFLKKARERSAAQAAQAEQVAAVAPSEASPQTVLDTSRPLSEQIERMQVEKISESKIIASDPKLDIDTDLKRRFGSNVKSALGSGTVIEGKFKFDSPVRVDGTLTGEINSTSVLIVGQEATIEGTVNVGSLIILGNVKAEVTATDLVEIRCGGRLEGDMTTKRITIEEGGYFRGKCTPA